MLKARGTWLLTALSGFEVGFNRREDTSSDSLEVAEARR